MSENYGLRGKSKKTLTLKKKGNHKFRGQTEKPLQTSTRSVGTLIPQIQ